MQKKSWDISCKRHILLANILGYNGAALHPKPHDQDEATSTTEVIGICIQMLV
jgi:hypothetical protein